MIPNKSRNKKHYTPRMMLRKRKKSEYKEFLKTLAPDLMISKKMLK